jgi:hypothetical protein
MINISIVFDDDILFDRERRGSSAFFYIEVLLNGRSFPSPGWMDFGDVILGWWIMACVQLFEGERETTFSFMDGPFRLRLVKQPDDRELIYYTQDEDLLGVTSIDSAARAVRDAACRVIEHFAALGVQETGQKNLSIGVEKLDQYLTPSP